MPTNELQIRANRANALLSTGPRTPAGKARSATNGRKHGLNGRHVILPGESGEEFATILAAATAAAGLPVPAAEAFWKLRRIARYWEELFERYADPCSHAEASRKLAQLMRYDGAIRGAFHRACVPAKPAILNTEPDRQSENVEFQNEPSPKIGH